MRDAGPGMVEGPAGIYAAWNLFEDYALKGSLPVKEILHYALDRLLESKTVSANLPAQGVTTLQAQPSGNRWVHHLLYASPVRRGQNVEVIEDLPVLSGIEATVAVPEPVREVTWRLRDAALLPPGERLRPLRPSAVVLPSDGRAAVLGHHEPKKP
ncbi:hypothetical protein HMSSN139_50130 [Paenibacillus sp. HMSSN-139]|nr:hypothetical protein HMSSN139_50130 [Paenibacillus sp. HMSSN-139]